MTMENTFFSSICPTFSRADHMLVHKRSFSKFRKTEIKPCVFSDHRSMKLKLNYKRKIGKHMKAQKLNNILLNNQWIKEEIKREIKYLAFLDIWDPPPVFRSYSVGIVPDTHDLLMHLWERRWSPHPIPLPSGEREHMFAYGLFMLMYGKNHHNIVK